LHAYAQLSNGPALRLHKLHGIIKKYIIKFAVTRFQILQFHLSCATPQTPLGEFASLSCPRPQDAFWGKFRNRRKE